MGYETTAMKRLIVVVHNAKSGSALPAVELESMFKEAGFDVSKMIAVSKSLAADLSPYVQKSMWVAAVGGDGTVSAVAGVTAGTSAVLIPLPGGTLNNFTKDLGINQDLQQAILDAARGKVKRVDIASVNGDYFVNNSSIGLYPRTLVLREKIQSAYGKWPAALYATLRALVLFRAYRVTLDDQHIVTPFVFVGNNDYQLESAGLSNRTSLSSGKLCIYAVRGSRRWSLVRLSLRSLFGDISADNELIAYRTSSLTIDSYRKRMHVSRDGEVATYSPPLHYQLHAKALNVVVAPKSKSLAA